MNHPGALSSQLKMGNLLAGPGQRTVVVAELSGNLNQNPARGLQLIAAAKEAGADAVKLQTYTADTITIKSSQPEFRISGGTIWDGQTLHELYEEAHTPWEWHPELFQAGRDAGLEVFSTPFDFSAVDFLQQFDPPAYKVASPEIIDLPLIRHVAATGKPLLMSTGMATVEEIGAAIAAARDAGCKEMAILKCTTAYPSPIDELNLLTIRDLSQRFGVPVGLSDHTLGKTAAVVAVTLGACLVEKHLTLNRSDGGPDAAFSSEPAEFAEMVDAIREAEQALGEVRYGPTSSEAASLAGRRSLYIVADIKAGETLTCENVRSIRPGFGMKPRYLDDVLGRRIISDVPRGTPLSWKLIGRAD
jgi:pseudaminic acid synthase